MTNWEIKEEFRKTKKEENRLRTRTVNRVQGGQSFGAGMPSVNAVQLIIIIIT